MREPDSPPLILAAGDRLARALREDLNLAERAAGRAVWRTPQVRSLRQWIADAWADAWPSAQLLGETQMLALWLDAVERDRHGVISATACAREAREAERLAQDWRLDLDAIPAYSDEQRAWRGWRRQVAATMRGRDWISAEHLPGLVAAGLRSGAIAAPGRVQLAGFERAITPAEAEVIAALRARCPVGTLPEQPRAAARIRGLRCADADAQLRLAVQHARQRLAATGDDETPPRIVIALADPEARRAALEGLLIEQLAPGLRRLGDDSARAPWRWDCAPPLAARPFAESLLAALALDTRDNAPEAVSRLLLSAWTLAPARHAQAAAADLKLRAAGWLRIAADDLAGLALPPLRERLAAYAAIVATAPRRALPSAWASHFEARLDALGWPGSEALPSAAFQQVQELRRALAGLAALDGQTGAIDAARARMWLRETLKRGFEPRADHAQPVRVVDAADAVGLACELLIVVDADAGRFPGPARGTPFLPIEALRAAGLPQASPAAWLARRSDEASALLQRAGECLLLVPETDERGGEVAPSPLFAAEWTEAERAATASLAETLAASGPHAALPERDPVPPVAAPETPRGSARLFELYAQAPFLAFCDARLGIAALPNLPRGLPASAQGQLVHGALAAFWDRVGDSANLRALDRAQRTEHLREALAPLLRDTLPAAHFGRTLVTLEAARLLDVLGRWLAFEAGRGDDFIVLGHERRVPGLLGGLPLSLRIDRIERAAGDPDAICFVDYKTGARVDANGWREDRLGAPQLPLYAVLLDAPAARDIAFGHVADGAPALLRWSEWSAGRRGAARPQHAGDFSAQRAAWGAALLAMAEGFMAGCAGVDPALSGARGASPLLALAGAFADDEPESAGGDAP